MAPRPPDDHLTPREEAAAIRRMTAAITGESPGAGAKGLLLGGLAAAAVSLLAFALFYSGGPPQRVYGVVTGFGVTEEQAVGTMPLVRVAIDDREATVSIPRNMFCRLGDRIELNRRKAILGYRYNASWRGCLGVGGYPPV
jgi:hypothetical protein